MKTLLSLLVCVSSLSLSAQIVIGGQSVGGGSTRNQSSGSQRTQSSRSTRGSSSTTVIGGQRVGGGVIQSRSTRSNQPRVVVSGGAVIPTGNGAVAVQGSTRGTRAPLGYQNPNVIGWGGGTSRRVMGSVGSNHGTRPTAPAQHARRPVILPGYGYGYYGYPFPCAAACGGYYGGGYYGGGYYGGGYYGGVGSGLVRYGGVSGGSVGAGVVGGGSISYGNAGIQVGTDYPFPVAYEIRYRPDGSSYVIVTEFERDFVEGYLPPARVVGVASRRGAGHGGAASVTLTSNNGLTLNVTVGDTYTIGGRPLYAHGWREGYFVMACRDTGQRWLFR